MTPLPLLTLSQLAEALGLRVHQARYLVKSRKVQPIAKIGPANCYLPGDLEYLRRELDRRRRGA